MAREHLESHGLDPTQGSILPNTGFTLPTLQGNSIDEHFHRIGEAAARPWLDLAKRFADVQSPPKPDFWHIHSGWTKYHHRDDGSSFYEQVSAPDEEMLSFDVETMPSQHHYAIMACAVSGSHWYSWISPWLLGETDDPQQLIPLGDRAVHRVVIGHNVSYDRARLLEEYHVDGTNTRFIDTMSLHVAVKGISSHQRPAWMKYRKSKNEEKERKSEAAEAAKDLLREAQEQEQAEIDAIKRAELRRLQEEIEESLPQLLADESDFADAETSQKRWEDITSANSLADVAKLHCGIDIKKEIRDDFMTFTREEIVEGIHDYLDYCASDVEVTHAVFKKVFPDFLQACLSPVSFAGVLSMGSSFLTVNEHWEEYLRNAGAVYRELNEKIKSRLLLLAEQARELMAEDCWKGDPWLGQLDWTPKVAGRSRGIDVPVKPKVKIMLYSTIGARLTNLYRRNRSRARTRRENLPGSKRCPRRDRSTLLSRTTYFLSSSVLPTTDILSHTLPRKVGHTLTRMAKFVDRTIEIPGFIQSWARQLGSGDLQTVGLLAWTTNWPRESRVEKKTRLLLARLEIWQRMCSRTETTLQKTRG